jgi:hypothetical protein
VASAETDLKERRPAGLRSSRSPALWFGVLGPPAAWGAHLVLGDLTYELGCSASIRGGRFLGLSPDAWTLIQTVSTFAVSLLASFVALRAWRSLRAQHNGTSLDRAQVLALAGIASGLLYALIIAYGFLPPLFLHTCGTSLTGAAP